MPVSAPACHDYLLMQKGAFGLMRATAPSEQSRRDCQPSTVLVTACTSHLGLSLLDMATSGQGHGSVCLSKLCLATTLKPLSS